MSNKPSKPSSQTGSVSQHPASDENLRRLDRLANLGTLSAGVAHEIKNALTVVKTFVELSLEKSDDKELAVAVQRELKRIDLMLSQVLLFAAPKAATFSTVRMHDLLDHVLRLLQHQISAKLILLQRDCRAAPDTVRGDDAQLQQVLMNLLLNAIEAMGPKGVLTIATATIGGKQLQIQIRDTGAGIAPENLERVFEPFFTTKKNGTGLGLAISKRITLEHQGAIEVQSEPGKGSVFTITLPVFIS